MSDFFNSVRAYGPEAAVVREGVKECARLDGSASFSAVAVLLGMNLGTVERAARRLHNLGGLAGRDFDPGNLRVELPAPAEEAPPTSAPAVDALAELEEETVPAKKPVTAKKAKGDK